MSRGNSTTNNSVSTFPHSSRQSPKNDNVLESIQQSSYAREISSEPRVGSGVVSVTHTVNPPETFRSFLDLSISTMSL
ncbi:unnamed protein product [Bathycoccus prasinos]